MGEMRRLYYQNKEKGSFKTFKWVLKGGWTPGGQDSQQPQYDKSRYRSVTVDVSKGGNINWDFYYNREPWYGNSIYYAIPQELVQDVINSK